MTNIIFHFTNRIGVMAAHLTLNQEVKDHNLDSAPNMPDDVSRR